MQIESAPHGHQSKLFILYIRIGSVFVQMRHLVDRETVGPNKEPSQRDLESLQRRPKGSREADNRSAKIRDD